MKDVVDASTQMSRNEFLKIVGAMALSFALLKVTTLQSVFTPAQKSDGLAYGNSAYGGRLR